MFDPNFFEKVLEISQNINIEKCADYLTHENSKFRPYFENDLGIDTAAVTIANVADNKLLVLKNYQLQYKLQREYIGDIQFPEFAYSRKNLIDENAKYLVDYLYLNLRKHQSLDKYPPEYYKYLTTSHVSEIFHENLTLNNLLKINNIVYIEAGEILFFLYASRFYFREALKEFVNDPERITRPDLDILSFLRYLAYEIKTDHYPQLVKSYDELLNRIENLEKEIEDEKAKGNCDGQKEDLLKILVSIQDAFCSLPTLIYDTNGFDPVTEHEFLGLEASPKMSPNTIVLDNFIRYHSDSGSPFSLYSQETNNPYKLHNVLKNIIEIYFGTKGCKTALDSLNLVHSKANYPIPLYYYQMAFDKHHHCFDVMFIPLCITNKTILDHLKVINQDNFSESNLSESDKSVLNTKIVVFGSFSLKPIEHLYPGTSCNYTMLYENDFRANECTNVKIPRCIKKFKCRKDFYPYKEDSISDEFKSRILKIQLIYRVLFEPIIDKVFYNQIILKQLNSIKEKATKAAISQVMARNMSHNIGSHVMNKLTDSSYLERFCPNACADKKQDPNKVACTDQICLKSYKPHCDIDLTEYSSFAQLSIFNTYVKCRMDYLSDMSFGTPLMQTSKYVYSDLFKELDKVRLLLENISGLPNFKYSIKFCIDGKEINKENDFQLAIPNDVLGSQALYNIIENVIRNTAKHAEKPKNKLTEFTVNFKEILTHNENTSGENEESKKLIEIEIFDNIDLSKRPNKDFIKGENFDMDIVAGKIEKNNTLNYTLKYIESLTNQQNISLNMPVLNDTNQLRTNSLGLLEMKASASYLRKIDLNQIDSFEYRIDFKRNIFNRKGNLNILTAVCVKKGYKCYLGYRFFMLRPQEVLIVTDEFLESNCKQNLLKDGIWVITSEEFIRHIHDNHGVYNHQYVVHDSLDSVKVEVGTDTNEQAPILEYYRTSLPLRILKFNELEIKLSTGNNSKEIIQACWGVWLDKQLKNRRLTSVNIRNGKVSVKSDEKLAVFLDHLNSLPVDAVNKILKDCPYVEILSSNAQQKLPNFSKITNSAVGEKLGDYLGQFRSDNNNPMEKNMIDESIITKISVVDERIQSALGKDYLGIKYSVLFDKANILIPNIKMDLSKNSFELTHIKKLKEYISNRSLDSDFLLIHYSILERMFNEDLERRHNNVNDYLIELAKNTNVVITSGRGTPEGLPKEVRFVSLSSVLYAFIEIRSKYLINYLLQSSRKSNRI